MKTGSYLEHKLKEKLEWGKYVSPTSDRKIAPFNWYRFTHRFGSGLVTELFTLFGLSKGDTVFDPFCGGGTTLIKAKLDGYNAVGLDISPFSVFLTKALTKKYNHKKLKVAFNKITHKIENNISIPQIAFLNSAFSENSLKYIYSLKKSIKSLSSPEKDFFSLVLLSLLNDVSKMKKSGGFLRITENRRLPASTIKNKFIELSEQLINQVEAVQFSDSSIDVELGDARSYPKMVNQKFDLILTSPPYPNRHDYTRIFGLELAIGFLETNEKIKKLRYKTLRSHVEARKRFDTNEYKRPEILNKIIGILKKRELNNAKVIETLEGYFEDMYLCLKQMSSVLKPEKKIGLVVSNVRFAGIMIPVDLLLAEIGEQLALKTEQIYVLRYRGNSPQQMKRHSKIPTRESLIIWTV